MQLRARPPPIKLPGTAATEHNVDFTKQLPLIIRVHLCLSVADPEKSDDEIGEFMSTEVLEVTLHLLGELRRSLLRLHKTLLDQETAAYEAAHGSITRGELLQLVISHEQFAWLHTISELIVRIDEMLSSKEPPLESDARALLTQAQVLLTPAETGNEFQRRYYDALQSEPDAVLAHREVMQLFKN